jgi:ABC-2 type transport system permease protein
MKTFYWLVKREFWEHRGGFLWAPIIVGAIFLVLNLMAVIAAEVASVNHGIRFDFGNDRNAINVMVNNLHSGQLSQVGAALDIAMYSASGLMAVVMGFIVLFYCLGTLYDERRDRSILFWKSLPMSDTATVLSKVIAATVLAPAIVFVTGVITGVLMLLLYAIVLSFHGVGIWQLLALGHPFQVVANLLGSIPLYLLWSLPTVGWLMLCSAWARNKPFLWAVLLPVGTGTILSWFGLMGSIGFDSKWYWSHIFSRLLLSVFPGGWFGALIDQPGAHSDPETASTALTYLNLSNSYSVLATANLWIGVAVGVAMIAAAIWFRRWRDDS